MMPQIQQIKFPVTQYMPFEVAKNQVVIHHTGSAGTIWGDVDWWKQTAEKVATHFIIGRDGQIYQLFDLKHWAYHLGVSKSINKIPEKYKTGRIEDRLNSRAVGIELDAWGQVGRLKDGTFINYLNKPVPANEIIDLGYTWRGERFFHQYTDKQMSSLYDLLSWLLPEIGLPLRGHKTDDIFNICVRALNGINGIYTHCSYRTDKVDAYPDARLLGLLKAFS